MNASAGPMELLAAGIPLTLLFDLVDPFGPRSAEILVAERADDAWLRPRATAHAA